MPKIEVRAEAILIRDGRILLARHEKKGAAYFVLPGGHVEHGETLAEALQRELVEELDLDAAVGELALVHDYIAKDRHVVNHAFRVTASGEPRVTPEGALTGAEWVPLADLGRVDLRPPIAAEIRRLAEAPGETIYLPGV